MKILNRKQIRKERLWNHFKYYIPNRVFGSDLREIRNYDPELYKDKFLDFQSNGRRNLSLEDYENIKPLIDAQGLKEIFINSVVIETLEWDSKGWGWIYPISSIIENTKDRLTKVALLKIKYRLEGRKMGKFCETHNFVERINFYESHPVKGLWPSEFNTFMLRLKDRYELS